MKFSVIVPAYNVEQYIEECIMSVLNQDYPQEGYEIIVVDDCTPDNSMAIVERLAKDHSNIRIIHHVRNLHQGGARNTGIREAKGDWIFFLDSDDKWITTNVFTTFDVLTEKNNGIDYVKSTSYSNSLDDSVVSARGEFIQAGYDYFLSDNYLCNVWMSCYKANFLRENDLYFREHVVYEDSDWGVKCAHNTSKVLIIDYPFYGYRLNPESTCQKTNIKSFKDNITSAFEIERLIGELSLSDEKTKVCRNLIKQSIFIFVKLTRQYKYSDGVKCLSKLKGQPIINPAYYTLSCFERIIFFMINRMPRVLVLGVKTATMVKRGFKRLF